MNTNPIHFLFLFLFYNPLFSQDFRPLLELGWKNNKQVESKEFELQQAEFAMREAKAEFFPQINFGTSYTLAAGGRSIDFPIGDLFNPVHNTLNQLTQSQSFPLLENQKVQFFPNNFYDSRFRIQQVLFHPDLKLNKQYKKSLQEQKALELKAYKRMLAKEIMQAFFTYQSSTQYVQIVEEYKIQLQEAKRVSRGLIQNGLSVPSALLRLEAESAKVESQLIQSRANQINSLQYLEFLLGTPSWNQPSLLPDLPDTSLVSIQVREELLQLQNGLTLHEISLKKEKANSLPRIGTQVDIGSQDFNFQFEPYVLLGLNLDLKIADFHRTRFKKNQIQSGIQSLQSQIEHTQLQIQLHQTTVRNNFISAVNQAHNFQIPIQSTEKLYREISEKYKGGSATYLEMVDALSQLNQSKLTFSLATLQAWLAWSEYVYTSALIDIP